MRIHKDERDYDRNTKRYLEDIVDRLNNKSIELKDINDDLGVWYMLAIKKKYIIDEGNHKIAVQLDINNLFEALMQFRHFKYFIL